MKLKRIFISKYKNIPEREIHFDTDLTSLIIGQNGLGKSNLLEALTLIFVAISNKDEYLNLSNFDGRYFAFDIEYTLRGKEIQIVYGIANKYQIKIGGNEYQLKHKDEHVYNATILPKIVDHLIPDYFVAYYSGQNKRLEEILKRFEIDYNNGLKANKDNNSLTTRRKFLYLKNFHSPILILVLSIFKDFEENGNKIYEEKINNLLKHLGIECVESFSLKLNSPYWISKIYKPDLDDKIKMERGFMTFIHSTLDANAKTNDKFPFPYWGLKSSLHKFLKCLTESIDIIPYDNIDEIRSNSHFKETVEFNNVSIIKFKENIYKEFDSPLELFYTIEALYLLDILDLDNDLKFDIKKGENLNLSYEALSEGENQLFIVLGMILITGVEETLFLLDEPDTYLNPQWQREYINLLEDFNLEDDDSHILVTTHSPLLVQNIEGENNYNYDLILLSRNDEGVIEIDQDKRIFTNWRIDQVLASKYFNITSTRPKSLDDYIIEKEAIIYNKSLSLEEKRIMIDALLFKYGEITIGESRNEIDTLLLINEFLKNTAND